MTNRNRQYRAVYEPLIIKIDRGTNYSDPYLTRYTMADVDTDTSGTRPSVSSYRLFTFVSNIQAIIILLVVFLVFETLLSPFNRGFFCDDESIAKPYRHEAISAVLVSVLALLFVIGVVMVCDIMNKKIFKIKQLEKSQMAPCRIQPWIYTMLARIVFGLVGLGICMVFVDVIKIMVGRLRPHFLAVCKPDLNNCTRGVFYDFSACHVTDEKKFKEAKKSFPSGHSGAASYATVFAAHYIQYAIRPIQTNLLKPVTQMLVLLGGIAVCLTRISDYFHHWSDVLGGWIIGMLSALYAIHFLLRLPSDFQSTPPYNTSHARRKASDAEMGKMGVCNDTKRHPDDVRSTSPLTDA